MSESRIMGIKGLHGIIRNTRIELTSLKRSVEASNHFESVLQTSFDNINAHGGEINIASAIGKGTKFLVILPV